MKKTRKEKKYKSQEDRRQIVNKIKTLFAEHGVSLEATESLKAFATDLDHYENIADLTSGFTNKLYIPEIKRYIEYRLPVRPQALEFVKLSMSP
jgi:hypothetical protein